MDKQLRFDDFLALIVPTSAAFMIAFNTTTLVQSLQSNILIPCISLVPGLEGNFGNGSILLKPAEVDAQGNIITPQITLQYGTFLTSFITFLIILFIIYLVIVATYKVTNGKIDGTRKL